VRATALAAAAALVTAACRPGHAPLADCAGDLSGVWQALDDDGRPIDGRAFDVRDARPFVEVYPMWDTTRPAGGRKPAASTDPAAPPPARVESPWRIRLERAGATVTGTLAVRVTLAGTTCSLTQPARVADCRGQRATLDLAVPRAVDPATCALTEGPERLRFTLERR
jgi:hypothetical protein